MKETLVKYGMVYLCFFNVKAKVKDVKVYYWPNNYICSKLAPQVVCVFHYSATAMII